MHQHAEAEHRNTDYYCLRMHDELLSKAYQAFDIAGNLL